jgi:hypothetical protein
MVSKHLHQESLSLTKGGVEEVSELVTEVSPFSIANSRLDNFLGERPVLELVLTDQVVSWATFRIIMSGGIICDVLVIDKCTQ